MEKEKKFMIIGILILLITLVGAAGTYAWFTWSSTSNTNLTMSIGASSDVIFKNGNDISTNKLAPVFNYTDGEKTSFTITNKSTTSFSYRISLNITSIDNELKNKSLKYKLVSNNTIITEGDFSNIENTNKLYEGELSKGNISYIFYLYIDGNEENNLNMINKSLVGTITVEEKPTLAKKITDLYTKAAKTTTTLNNITYNLASSVGLMNDRKGSMSTGIDAGNIRYYGANPNNYIYFNCSDYSNQSSSTCELWRIIGVFDGKVKIMRNESIGSYPFDINANMFDDDIGTYYGSNNWETSKLMKLLNEGYEDYQDLGKYNGTNILANNSLYWNNASGNCFRSQGSASLPIYVECDFTNTGLKNNKTKNLIATTTWHLGGITTGTSYPNQVYNLEQGTTVVSGHATEWTGKVTIPYVSDYGYATDLSLCTKTIDKYTDVSCSNNNWMLNIIPTISGYAIRFLTPRSDYETAGFHVENAGYFADININVSISRLIHPTLFLNTEIRLDETTAGTSTDPYKLIID